MNVFILDDEDTIVRWLVDHVDWVLYDMNVIGYSTNAPEALDMLNKGNVDLLITDIQMPLMNGLELIALVKQKWPDIAVIIISAYENFQYVKKALSMGVNNYLVKPIDLAELTNNLTELREQNKLKDSLNQSKNGISIFRNNIIRKWVKYMPNDETFIEQAELAGINLTHNIYTVITITLDYKDQKSMPLIFEYCNNNELITANSFFVDNNSEIVGVLTESNQSLIAIIQELHGRLIKLFNVYPFFCIGYTVDSWRNVYQSYHASSLYLPLYVLGNPIFYCDVLNKEGIDDFNTKTFQLNIELFLADNNYAEVNAYCKRLVEKSKNTRSMKELALTVAMLLIRKAFSGNLQITDPIKQKIRTYHLLNQKTDVIHWLDELINKIIHHINDSEMNFHPYVRRAIKLMEAEYHDPNLSLSSIADGIPVSAMYLGQLFYTETNRYFNDYLSVIRLTRATCLLRSSDNTIGEISRKVGFSSQSYMSRVFKKQYNVTALEYRRRYQAIHSGG